MQRTIESINEKILSGKASVLTASEAKNYIAKNGKESFLKEIDVVICSSYELNTNGLLTINFGQTDPLIYFDEVSINGVKVSPVGSTDVAIPIIGESESNPKYGGAHIIEDLISGKDLLLKATGKELEVFPNKGIETWFNKDDVNGCQLILNQGLNQNNIVATNSGEKDINSPMGTLIGNLENSTFNSSSFLNPLINDPNCQTIGVGSKLMIGGAEGIVISEGSNYITTQKCNERGIPLGPCRTLSIGSTIDGMSKKFLRGGYINSYGPVLYVAVALPIPVLNMSVADSLSVMDEDIPSTIVDFSIPRRSKPALGVVSYSELRSTTVTIKEKPTLSAPISSLSGAIEAAEEMKSKFISEKILLSPKIRPLKDNIALKLLDPRLKRES